MEEEIVYTGKEKDLLKILAKEVMETYRVSPEEVDHVKYTWYPPSGYSDEPYWTVSVIVYKIFKQDRLTLVSSMFSIEECNYRFDSTISGEELREFLK